jgi:hypothetical protein
MAHSMFLPQQAKIESIGLGSIKEIENHRVEGSIFVQYRCAVLDDKGKQVDVVLQRFNLPVCIYSTSVCLDLRELTLSEIESRFMVEAQRVFLALPSPLRRVEPDQSSV